MKIKTAIIILAIALASCRAHRSPAGAEAAEPAAAPTETQAPKRVAGYYTNDMPSYTAADIDYAKVTHVLHGFLLPNSDGSITVPFNYLNSGLISRAHAAGVRVLCTLGGPGAGIAAAFRDIAASQAACDKLAEEFESICRSYGYDGIDMNWEFPESAGDRTGQNMMLKAIYDRFNSAAAPAPSWEICLAVPATDWYARWYDYNTLNNYVDYYNIMLFPFHGAWAGHSGHNAPLYAGADPDGASCDASINYYLNTRRVPPGKLNFGLGFFGLYFTTSETLLDDCGGYCSCSEYMYRDITGIIASGWEIKRDAASAVPYAEKTDGAGLIVYDDPESIAAKASYAFWSRQLGGVFIWKLGADESGGSSPLLEAVHQEKNR